MIKTKAPILNALTVDLEDYFQVQAFADLIPPRQWDEFESRVECNTARVLDLLASHDLKATFFILGWEAERRPTLIKRIAMAGHEIACHGYGHQLIYRIGPKAFRADVLRSKALLEDLTGLPILGYRAPSYSITRKSLWAIDILIESGFTYDSSIVPARHDIYGLPGAPRFPYRIAGEFGMLTEFPPSTMRPGIGSFRIVLPIGGGGYLRLYPLWVTRLGLRSLNETDGMPFSVYVHPWELDPGQPRLAGPPRSRFRHYFNLHNTEERLHALLRSFNFGTMRDAIDFLTVLPTHEASKMTAEAAA